MRDHARTSHQETGILAASMNVRKHPLAAVLSLSAALPAAQAATLGTVPLDINFGSFGEPSAAFAFAIGDDVINGIESGAVLFDRTLTAADDGQTFTVSSGGEFQQAVGFLTNGTNDWIFYQFGVAGIGWTEGGYFHGDYTGAHGTDLAGSQIQSISLHIGSLTFVPAPDDPDFVFPEDFNRLIGSVTIDGIPAIPEPTPTALLGLGLAALATAWRRRAARP